MPSCDCLGLGSSAVAHCLPSKTGRAVESAFLPASCIRVQPCVMSVSPRSRRFRTCRIRDDRFYAFNESRLRRVEVLRGRREGLRYRVDLAGKFTNLAHNVSNFISDVVLLNGTLSDGLSATTRRHVLHHPRHRFAILSCSKSKTPGKGFHLYRASGVSKGVILTTTELPEPTTALYTRSLF